MEIKRGDILTCIPPGDIGKPRPAVIVQANIFNTTRESVTICLLTSELINAPLFRVRIKPGPSNALKTASDVMADKIMTVRKQRLTKPLGHLTAQEMQSVDDALACWLGIAAT